MTAALILIAVGIAILVALLGSIYLATVSGALVLDTGWGRRLQPLGPLSMDVAAGRDTVFALLTQPYLGRTPRSLADKVRVLQRGSDMVLAAHRTPIRGRLVATTIETVTFTAHDRIDFRLMRGPVPHVVETFALTDTDAGCRLDYTGELGTDFGPIGSWWGRIVAVRWQAAVESTMTAVRAEAERQTRRR